MHRRRLKWLLAVPCLYCLYFLGLSDAGLLGPDEPRYASIGREMALSGDWVTPRLWGESWFEKPALLYWLVGASFRAGVTEDLAPRLPIAIISVAFLLFYYVLLRRMFGWRAALFATAILGTSAGWLGFSHAAVTDLPLAATFSAAMLLGLRWIETGGRRALTLSAALLGLAVLAKGLVPIVLALPLFWMGRKRLLDWFRPPFPIAAFLITAAPWYVLCTQQNGIRFLEEFFLKHHFQRFYADVLLHQQPFWFYIPVLLAGLFPWTPLLVLLARKGLVSDRRRMFLLLWVLFGFVFFSASTNKLPGYLLPLFPAACALMGLALDEAKNLRWVLASAALLLVLVPIIAATLPAALLEGLSTAEIGGMHLLSSLLFLCLASLVWWWEARGHRFAAVTLLTVSLVACVAYLKVETLPALDRTVSARPLWRQIASNPDDVCVGTIHRSFRYGLNYYARTPLPDCGTEPSQIRIEQGPSGPPYVVR